LTRDHCNTKVSLFYTGGKHSHTTDISAMLCRDALYS